MADPYNGPPKKEDKILKKKRKWWLSYSIECMTQSHGQGTGIGPPYKGYVLNL